MKLQVLSLIYHLRLLLLGLTAMEINQVNQVRFQLSSLYVHVHYQQGLPCVVARLRGAYVSPPANEGCHGGLLLLHDGDIQLTRFYQVLNSAVMQVFQLNQLVVLYLQLHFNGMLQLLVVLAVG